MYPVPFNTHGPIVPHPRIPRSCDPDFHMRDESGNLKEFSAWETIGVNNYFLGAPMHEPSLESIYNGLGITGIEYEQERPQV